MASITVSDAKTLVISPWDKSQIQAIEKGIRWLAGFNPSNDGVVVRITLPALNEERKKEMAKLVSQLAEKGKLAFAMSKLSIKK